MHGGGLTTKSGARSAQFEHMVLITENGAEVLTQRKGNTTTTETKDED
jgi:methionyl aminopeptidase